MTVKREAQEECHEIISTPGHKYYVPFNTENRSPNERQEHASYMGLSNKWVSAIHLKYGDRVLLSDDTYGIIQSVTTLHLSTPETTYNFEVEDYHTYFVGNGVCVHNTGCGTPDLYRGGNKMKVRTHRDVEILDDLVQPTKGISVNSNPNAVANFGGAHKIGVLPDGLKIVHTVGTHFEIVPAYAMRIETYQTLLYKITLTPWG